MPGKTTAGVSEDLPVAERIHSCEYCEWGYFENEASEVDFYIYASLHVRIPKVGEGVRAGLESGKRSVQTTKRKRDS